LTTAGVIESTRERERQRRLARQRLLERLRLLLRYVEDTNAFFTGDSIMTLESERTRLQESATGADKILGSDEQRLYNEAKLTIGSWRVTSLDCSCSNR
jgi:hypothetical protein